MLSTAQALAATILVAVIVLPPVFWLYSSSPDASPLTPQIVGNLLVACDTVTVGVGQDYVGGDLPADPDATYYFTTVITRLYTNITMTVKNTLGETVTIDRIIPMGVNISALGIDLSYRVKPGVATTIETPVVWTRDVKLYAPVSPGDKWVVAGGILKKVEDGRILVLDMVPDNPPLNYSCPFGDIYDLKVAGKTIMMDAESPGCAPTMIATLPKEFFLVAAFTPSDYLYPENDVTFYVHINASDNIFPGVAYLGGAGDGSYVSLQSLATSNTSFYPGPAVTPIPLAVKYNDGSIIAYTAGGQIIGDAVAGVTPQLYLGLARQVPVTTKVQVAIVLDSSQSMGNEWDEVRSALSSAFEILAEKNVEIALVEFTGPKYLLYVWDKWRRVGVDIPAIDIREEYADYYIYYDDYIGLADFTSNITLITTLLSDITPLFKPFEPSADAMYAALSMLSWDTSPATARAMVLIVDECDQAIEHTSDEVIELAQRMGVKIFVIMAEGADENCWPSDYSTGELYSTYVQATGGQLLVIGVNATRVGETLINIIENVNMTPTTLKTNIDYFGVFKSSVVTIDGLYPGDRIVVSAGETTTVVEASGPTVSIDLLNYFTIEDIVSALLNGGIQVAVQPSTEHLLSLLPDRALVHVRGENVDKWVEVPLYVHFDCSLLHGVVNGMVRVVSNGGTYTVYVDGMNVGTYPAVRLVALGYEVEVDYADGTRRTITVGDVVMVGAQQAFADARIEIILDDPVPFYDFGKMTALDDSIIREIRVEGRLVLVETRLSK